MKTKRSWGSALPILLGAILAGCSGPTSTPPADVKPFYAVNVRENVLGTLTVVPDAGMAGTHVKVWLNPKPGYVLKTDTLRYFTSMANSSAISLDTMGFDLPANNVFVEAQFEPAPSGTATVTTTVTGPGRVAAFPLSGGAGTVVTLAVSPDPGYGVVAGSLQVNGTPVAGPPYTFTLGGSNVTVTASFEPKGLAGLLADGQAALTAGDYDAAFQDYEAAYQKDPSNTEAAVYSTLGQLGSILTDTRVRGLLKQVNLSWVSPDLTGWAHGSQVPASDAERAKGLYWVTHYYTSMTDTVGTDLPRLNPPNGFPGGFINYTTYQRNVADYLHRDLFDVLLFWNMVASNRGGLNTFLDNSLAYLYGDAFQTAVTRAATIPYGTTVALNPTLRADLQLDKFLGSTKTTIGRAELDLVLGSLWAWKATLEYAAEYDWQTDLSPLMVALDYYDKLNDYFRRLLDPEAPLKLRLAKAGTNSLLGTILPLRTHFLKDRNNGMLARSKADLQRALDALSPALALYFTAGPGALPADATFNDYKMLGDGAAQLKQALATGGVFSYPTTIKGASWPAPADAPYAVNLTQLFTPGQLSLDRVLVTEDEGLTPVFFGFADATSSGVALTDASQAAGYPELGFQLNAKALKEVFVKGLEGYGDTVRVDKVFPDLLFAPDNAREFYTLYQAR